MARCFVTNSQISELFRNAFCLHFSDFSDIAGLHEEGYSDVAYDFHITFVS